MPDNWDRYELPDGTKVEQPALFPEPDHPKHLSYQKVPPDALSWLKRGAALQYASQYVRNRRGGFWGLSARADLVKALDLGKVEGLVFDRYPRYHRDTLKVWAAEWLKNLEQKELEERQARQTEQDQP